MKQGNNAKITWEVGSEVNNINYELMHSTNAQDWSSINVQKSMTSSNGTYEFLHQNVSKGMNYYRLKIVDAGNNLSKYGPTRSLSFDHTQGYSIIIHPNPVTENVTISTSDASFDE